MLIDDYNRDCYYWEIVELVRKLLLAGVLMFIGRGSPLQGAGGICIAFVFFAWQVKSRPFKLAVHNDIKAIWDAVLFVALLSTLLLKTDLRVQTLDRIGTFLAYFILSAMIVMLPLIAYGLMKIWSDHLERQDQDESLSGGLLANGSTITNPMQMLGDAAASGGMSKVKSSIQSKIKTLEDSLSEFEGPDRAAMQARIEVLRKQKDQPAGWENTSDFDQPMGDD